MAEQKEIILPNFTPSKGVNKLDIEQYLAEAQEGNNAAEGSVILDIRTPAEYESGHIAGAHSFPLFSNDERAIVGTIYKKEGKDIAVEKGLEFVGPKLHKFVKEAKRFGKSNKFYLYCWRGGMRSGSMAWLLSTAGLDVTTLIGGYKAYRQSFLDNIIPKDWRFITLSGSTGVGKTELLKELQKRGEQVLDLEGLANHKGSAFGGIGQEEQPTTEEYINRIHQKLREFTPSKVVWVESESILVGKCFIQVELFAKLTTSNFYTITMEREERVKRLVEEYGYLNKELIIESLEKISKRMGYDKSKEAIDSFNNGNIEKAVSLALDYYDKLYSNSSSKRTGKELEVLDLSGNNHKAIAEYLMEKNRMEEKR